MLNNPISSASLQNGEQNLVSTTTIQKYKNQILQSKLFISGSQRLRNIKNEKRYRG